MKEREIALQEIVWKCMLDWRRALVCAVIFAVLTMVLQYTQAQKSYEAAMEAYEKQLAVYESGEGENEHSVDMTVFTTDELQQISDAKSLQSMLDRSRSYMQNSILMNINAYKKNVLILEYYVDSDYKFNYQRDIKPDYTSAVVEAYANYVKDGEMAQLIKDNMDLNYELRYIEEIVEVTEGQSGSSFTVEIICTEDMASEDVAVIVKEALGIQTAGIAERIGGHSLELISENTTIKADAVLANQQQTYQNMINNYRNQLNVLKNAMTGEQLEVLGIVVVTEEEEDEGEEQEVEPQQPVKPGVSVKYLLLGFIAGIFFSAVWTACEMLFASRLQNVAELSDLYKLRLFGLIPVEKKQTGIDGYLLKAKNRHKKQMTMEEWLNVICANIELVCKDGNLGQIYLTGSEWEKVDPQIIQQLVSRLTKIGVSVSYGGNICYDMTSLRTVHEIGAVILLEQENLSIYREIEQEVRVLAEQNVNVLGCVGIG